MWGEGREREENEMGRCGAEGDKLFKGRTPTEGGEQQCLPAVRECGLAVLDGVKHQPNPSLGPLLLSLHGPDEIKKKKLNI